MYAYKRAYVGVCTIVCRSMSMHISVCVFFFSCADVRVCVCAPKLEYAQQRPCARVRRGADQLTWMSVEKTLPELKSSSNSGVI